MDYPEIDLQSSDELAIEQGTHVIWRKRFPETKDIHPWGEGAA